LSDQTADDRARILKVTDRLTIVFPHSYSLIVGPSTNHRQPRCDHRRRPSMQHCRWILEQVLTNLLRCLHQLLIRKLQEIVFENLSPAPTPHRCHPILHQWAHTSEGGGGIGRTRALFTWWAGIAPAAGDCSSGGQGLLLCRGCGGKERGRTNRSIDFFISWQSLHIECRLRQIWMNRTIVPHQKKLHPVLINDYKKSDSTVPDGTVVPCQSP
jgi:hypothetical protein